MANWIETWMDKLARTMAVTDPHGQPVRSFLMFERNEMPDAIAPEMMPCAFSYAMSPEVQYSLGGPLILLWTGRTEFHLTPDVKPANIPYIMKFFEIVLRACAAEMQLDGTVKYFSIQQNTPNAMMFATYKNFAGEDDHQGIIVNWQVQQHISGDLTVSQ